MNALSSPPPFTMTDIEKEKAAKEIDFVEASTTLLPAAIRPVKVQQDHNGDALLQFGTPEAAKGFQAGLDMICGNTKCFLRGVVCGSRALFSLDKNQTTIRTGKVNALSRLMEGLAEIQNPSLTGNNNTDVAQAFLDGVAQYQQQTQQQQR